MMNNNRAPLGYARGPWEAQRQRDIGTAVFDVYPAYGGDWIAEVNGEANARLISAAPDLLDVCKLLLSAYERERQRIAFGASSQAEAAAAVKLKRAARAAIAMAEPEAGEASGTPAIEKGCG